MRMGLVIGGLAGLLAAQAWAGSGLDVQRAVYVERQVAGVRALEPASRLRSGDKVVLVVAWQGSGSARRTTVQSSVPATLAFQRVASDDAQVSVDGGRSWGRLGSLRVGSRLASPEDVTDIRLDVASQADGRLTYSAIVR